MHEQPQPPVVSPDIYRALVDSAMELRRLEPWKFLDDGQIIGLQDTPDGPIRIASILGCAQQVYGLIIFRRKSGIRWILETLGKDHTVGLQHQNFLLSQDCLKIEFLPKSALDHHGLAALKAIDFMPEKRIRNVWPQFLSFMPGYIPWHIDQEEAIQLTADLQRLLPFLRLEKETSVFKSHPAGEVPFLSIPSSPPLRMDEISWQRLILPNEPPPQPIPLSESDCQSLLKAPQNKQMVWEVDCLYGPQPVLDNPRPSFPWFFLAVDKKSRTILQAHMEDRQTSTCEATAAKQLLRTFREANIRPGAIHLSNPDLAAALSEIAIKLNIRLFIQPSLPTLHAIYLKMQESMQNR